METKHVLKLIDGKFIPSEAGKVLFDLISRKINYHQMVRFSNEERFGKDESNSKSIIKQLKEERRRLEEIIDYTSKNGLDLKIEILIDIKFIKET
jgi:hypothetical protein